MSNISQMQLLVDGSDNKESENSNGSQKLNYLAIQPKKASAAEQQLKLDEVKKSLKDLGSVWLGGKKSAEGQWDHPNQLYYAIPKEHATDLLQLFDLQNIDLSEVELTPTYVTPKNIRKAAAIASDVATIRQHVKNVDAQKNKEIKTIDDLFSNSEINEKEHESRLLDINDRYKSKIHELQSKAEKLEEIELASLKNSEDNSFIVEPGKTHLAAEKGTEILANHMHGVFQRSAQTVRLVCYQTKPTEKECKKKSTVRPVGSLQISEADEIFLIKKLSKTHVWKKFDARSREHKQIDFPDKAAKMILSEKGRGLPLLKGFICSPTIRQNGSLLTQPGYDVETGLFFDPSGTEFPDISDHPTKDQAIAALSFIKELLKDFPFEDEVSRSVALSELMTAVVRRSLPLAPLFANDAPSASSGKTLLAKLAGYIATGKSPVLISPTRNEEEMRKRLAASLTVGDLVICIDNLDFPFASRDLCVISTSETWQERILGSSKAALIETNSQIIFTGNNLVFIGDLCTRFLKCRLIPKKRGLRRENSIETSMNTFLSIEESSYRPS